MYKIFTSRLLLFFLVLTFCQNGYSCPQAPFSLQIGTPEDLGNGRMAIDLIWVNGDIGNPHLTQVGAISVGFVVSPYNVYTLEEMIPNPVFSALGWSININHSTNPTKLSGIRGSGQYLDLSSTATFTVFRAIITGPPGQCLDVRFNPDDFRDIVLGDLGSGINCPADVLGPQIEVCIPSITISGLIESIPPLDCDDNTNHGIPNVDVEFLDLQNNLAFLCDEPTGPGGEYQSCPLGVGGDYRVLPTKEDNLTCGVTTYDIALLRSHLLETDCFTEAWQIIAGDMDQDGILSTVDIIYMRQLLLGIPLSIDFNSWRFVPTEIYDDINSSLPVTPPCSPLNIVPPFEGHRDVFNASEDVFLQDFIGIKIGDVNGTCEDCDGISEKSDGSEDRSKNIARAWLQNDHGQVEKDKVVDLEMYLDAAEQIKGFNTILDVPADLFEVQGVYCDLPSSHVSLDHRYDPATGLLYIVLLEKSGNGIPVQPDRPIVHLQLKAKAYLNGLSGVISQVSHESIDQELVDIDSRPYTLQLGFRGSAHSHVARHSISPNPFTETLNISYFLEQPSKTVIRLYGTDGKTLGIYEHMGQRGENKFSIQHLSNMPKGLIFYDIRSGDQLLRGKLVHLFK